MPSRREVVALCAHVNDYFWTCRKEMTARDLEDLTGMIFERDVVNEAYQKGLLDLPELKLPELPEGVDEEFEYAVNLCAHLLLYSVFTSEKVANVSLENFRRVMRKTFSKEVIDEAIVRPITEVVRFTERRKRDAPHQPDVALR